MKKPKFKIGDICYYYAFDDSFETLSIIECKITSIFFEEFNFKNPKYSVITSSVVVYDNNKFISGRLMRNHDDTGLQYIILECKLKKSLKKLYKHTNLIDLKKQWVDRKNEYKLKKGKQNENNKTAC